jgi:hypothetical protein
MATAWTTSPNMRTAKANRTRSRARMRGFPISRRVRMGTSSPDSHRLGPNRKRIAISDRQAQRL